MVETNNTKGDIISISHSLNVMGVPAIMVQFFADIVKDNKYVLMLIDTGSDHSIVDLSVMRYYNTLIREVHDETLQIATIGKKQDSAVSAIFDFSVNDVNFSHRFICMDCQSGFDKVEQETGHRLYGILGTDFLVKNKWIIDFNELTIRT